jgi:hypothetical protein
MASNNGLLNGAALGATLAELLEDNAQEPEQADAPAPPANTLPVFSNFEWVTGEGGKPKKRGLALPDICQELNQLTGDWPRRIEKDLFVPGANFEPRFLETHAELFAWLAPQAHPDWARGSDMISPECFLAHLKETAQQYATIEQYPHFPALPAAYYLHPPLPISEGQYLEQFVDFFNPFTDLDRELIKAFVMSLAWGGPPGSRPAWLFTAPDDDPHGGRGVGKSKCIELCAELVGGMVEISPNEDIFAIKKRLLSPAARTLRLARIDNVKTYRFSWADLEGLITSPIISGHRMYCGEGRRPNYLTWALTLNGASLSKDLATRVVVVKLARPQYSPNWEDTVRAYIEEHRSQILNDIRLALNG